MSGESKSKAETAYGSNALRLGGRQWLCVGLLVLLVFWAAPRLWNRFEPFTPEANYRVPYALSNDYWHYQRYAEHAMSNDRIPVLGDSVVWGEYVAPGESLADYLNQESADDRFANLGVNGIHPAALSGLMTHYGGAIQNRPVLLHYNPLWMGSPRHDLQDKKATRFNHPRLVPQLVGRPVAYKAGFSERFGVVVAHRFAFRAWMNHIAVAYFDNSAPVLWHRDHPTENPVARLAAGLPAPKTDLRHDPVAWDAGGFQPTPFSWVPPAESNQWRFFQETVDTLQSRGNQVFVLLGPFNEHMIAAEGKERYAQAKAAMTQWLDASGLPYWAPDTLPSQEYADASHPLAPGYQRLAQQLWMNPQFQAHIAGQFQTAAKK